MTPLLCGSQRATIVVSSQIHSPSLKKYPGKQGLWCSVTSRPCSCFKDIHNHGLILILCAHAHTVNETCFLILLLLSHIRHACFMPTLVPTHITHACTHIHCTSSDSEMKEGFNWTVVFPLVLLLRYLNSIRPVPATVWTMLGSNIVSELAAEASYSIIIYQY